MYGLYFWEVKQMKLYSNEIVFRGHPDKICDQIAGALLTAYLKGDKKSRVAVEVMIKDEQIYVVGEVTSNANIDIPAIAKRVLKDIGYKEEYNVIVKLSKQSQDISDGVDVLGAGDQGMMFGYACNDTKQYLPKAMVILQDLSRWYDALAHSNNNFNPDGKAQITGLYDDDFNLVAIDTFLVSYCNNEEHRDITDQLIKNKILNLCKTYNIEKPRRILINPTGKFLLGGSFADSGLTGRKIVVDAYEGFANVGGGSMNGKDPTKVDISAAYKAREIAKRLLKEKNLKWCEVQLSYAIGVARPMAIYVDSDIGNIEVPESYYVECEPKNIINDLKLLDIDYEEKAKFGHFVD
ncbi:MAG: methionine adenosyltransferase [Erysipelotrichaceae bacterium]|nr:methionine adenosyltransferase [Erysipelotrichaceae bacterium]